MPNLMNSTAATPGVLVSGYITSSESTRYSVPNDAAGTKITSARLTNTSASAVVVSLSVVKSGGTAGASNRVLSSYSLGVNDGIELSEVVNTFLGPGDFISGIASATNVVTLVMSGVAFT